MPRLNVRLSDCVFYLYGLSPKTGDIVGPCGTGSIVGRPAEAKGAYHHLYGITNWHVAITGGSSIVRLNTNDGKTRFLEYEPTDWQFIPKHDDIAAVDLMEDVSETDQVMFISEKQFISREALKHLEIGLGDDVFMIGLYANQDGGERNIPCGRFGNLAMAADERAPVEQPNGVMRESHLADMRSRTGFSGSPVFAYRIPAADLSRPLWPLDHKSRHGLFPPSAEDALKNHFMGLLGIHCSQFLETIEVSKTLTRLKERIGDPTHEGDDLSIPGAMNIVIPAWRVSELLDLEIFEMARQKREPHLRAALKRRPCAESITHSTSDENPAHREDFTALLNAAAQKPQSKD